LVKEVRQEMREKIKYQINRTIKAGKVKGGKRVLGL